MAILIRALSHLAPGASRRQQHVTMSFSDAVTGASLGTADFTLFPFANTLDRFEHDTERGSVASRLVSAMTNNNYSEARVLYYESDTIGSGSLERLHVPADRAGEVLRVLRRSVYGELADVIVTLPELLAGMGTQDAERSLRSAGFRQFEDTAVWVSSKAVPEE